MPARAIDVEADNAQCPRSQLGKEFNQTSSDHFRYELWSTPHRYYEIFRSPQSGEIDKAVRLEYRDGKFVPVPEQLTASEYKELSNALKGNMLQK